MSKKVIALISMLILSAFLFTTVIAESAISDGSYVPDGFSWSGGSGRLKGIECESIRISEGKAFAEIVILSDKYSYISINGTRYSCEHTGSQSRAEIPVRLNADNTILACTTAMSAPHEVEYHIRVELEAAKVDSGDMLMLADTAFTPDPESNASLFRIYRNENASVISIEDIGYYYVTETPDNIPDGISSETTVIIQPQHIYIDSPAAAEFACVNAVKSFDMVSDELSQTGDLPSMLETGSVTMVKQNGQTDYKALLAGKCDLAILSCETCDTDTCEYLKMLDIPVFFDRSSEEECAEGMLAWNTVYAILMGIEGDDL